MEKVKYWCGFEEGNSSVIITSANGDWEAHRTHNHTFETIDTADGLTEREVCRQNKVYKLTKFKEVK